MRFEATVEEIRALLQLAEFDAEAVELPIETYCRRREATQRPVAGALLKRYQTLLDAGRRPAITPIEGGSCSGCHVRLPIMVESQARRSPAIYTCQHCRRMIYAPAALVADGPHLAPPAERPVPRRAKRTPRP